MKETTVDRGGRQTLEGKSQALLIVRANGTYANRSTIAQRSAEVNLDAA
jgi:hypothetical protein